MFATLSSSEEFWLTFWIIALAFGYAMKRAVDTTKAAVTKVAHSPITAAVTRGATTSVLNLLFG